MKTIGLIVNPIAGMGGRVGLKGTDGQEILNKALILGATPISPVRAIKAIQKLSSMMNELRLVTPPDDMGEDEAKICGFNPTVVGSIAKGKTTAKDTKNAAKEMLKQRVDLILFAGGDGTARDICEAIDQKTPTLGIPAGVKIHSGVFAITPVKAGELAVEFLKGNAELCDAEVMDIDEDAFRRGRVSARLYGYLKVPFEINHVQSIKCASLTRLDERRNQETIAEYVIEKMDDDFCYILGSGTTVKAIADKLGVKKTLLGIDVVQKSKIVANDVNEKQLLKLIEGKKAKIIVSPIGGQGFIFGRGNQQISPEVIRKIGKNNIIVVATSCKLSSIGLGRPLFVDTGNAEVNKMLSGYVRVITGYKEEVVLRIAA